MLKKPKTIFVDKNVQRKKEIIFSILLIEAFCGDKQIRKNSKFINILYTMGKILDMSSNDIKLIIKDIFSAPYKSSLYTIEKDIILLSDDFSLKDLLDLFKNLYNMLGEKFIDFVGSFDYYLSSINWEFVLGLAIKDEQLIYSSLVKYKEIYFLTTYVDILLACEDLSFIKDSNLRKILNDFFDIIFNNLQSYGNIEEIVKSAKNILKLIKANFKIKDKYLNKLFLPLFLFLEKDILEDMGKALPDNYRPKYLAMGLASCLNNDEKNAALYFSQFVPGIKLTYFKNQFPWFSIVPILILLVLYRNNYFEEFNHFKEIIFSLTGKLTSVKLLKEITFDKAVMAFDPIYKRRLELNELSVAYYAAYYLKDKYYSNFTKHFKYERLPYLKEEILAEKNNSKSKFVSVLSLLKSTNLNEENSLDSFLILSTLQKKPQSNAELILGIKNFQIFPYKKEKLKNGKTKITQLNCYSLKENRYKWISNNDKVFSSFFDSWGFNYNMLELLIDSNKIYTINEKNEFFKAQLKKVKPMALCKLEENELVFHQYIANEHFLTSLNDTVFLYSKGSDALKSISDYLTKKDDYYQIKTASIKESSEIMGYLSEEINFDILVSFDNADLIKKLKYNKMIDYDNGIWAYAGTTDKKYSIDFFYLPFDNFDYHAPLDAIFYYIQKEEEKILINFYNKRHKELFDFLIQRFPSLSHFNAKLKFDTFEQLLKALTVLNDMEGIKVKISEELMVRNSYKVSERNVNIKIKEAGNYFEIDGKIDLSNNKFIEFKNLLDKIYNNIGNFVKIKEGEYIELNKDLLKKLKNIATISFPSRDKLKVNKKIYNIFNSEEFKKKIDKVFQETFEVPDTFKGILRDYQFEGYNWLVKMYKLELGACLGDDMGLGKTVQAIAFMEKVKNEKPFIIIVPASLIFNWEREIRKFSTILNPVIYFQNRDIKLEDLTGKDALIISYGLLVNDIKKLENCEFNVAIYDEAQLIKNFNTIRSDISKSINAQFKMITTGTPIENNLLELWNLMDLINPGVMGTVEQFKKKFINCDNTRLKLLKNAIKTFILRRTKKEVLKELPEKTEIIIDYNLSDEEKAFYNALKVSAMEKLEKMSDQEVSKNAMTILSEIIKLKQACCYPGLVDESIEIKESSKINTLFQLIEELINSGHKALIFSQFVQFLKIIEKELKKRKIKYSFISGTVPITKRKKIIDEFQNNDNIKLFLLSLKTGGMGLNLTAADIVIHLDPWWNPAVENQASDRIYRIGQKKAVVIYKLISKGTIEEKILTLQNKKQKLADFLLSDTNKVEKVNVKDLFELLK